MIRLIRRYWPLGLFVLLYLGGGLLSSEYEAELATLFAGDSSAFGMTIFLLIGLLASLVPTMNPLPLVPIASALWGWPATGVMLVIIWAVAGQILFEMSRLFGKGRVEWMLPSGASHTVATLVSNKSRLRSFALRFVVDGEIISYAFGLFSTVSSIEFFLMSFFASIPAAMLIAYVGTMNVWIQGTMVGVGAVLFIIILSTSSIPRVDALKKRFLTR